MCGGEDGYAAWGGGGSGGGDEMAAYVCASLEKQQTASKIGIVEAANGVCKYEGMTRMSKLEMLGFGRCTEIHRFRGGYGEERIVSRDDRGTRGPGPARSRRWASSLGVVDGILLWEGGHVVGAHLGPPLSP